MAKPPDSRSVSTFLVAALAATLCSCSGGGGTDSMPPTLPTPTFELSVAGAAVVKVQSNALGATVMEEKLSPLLQPGPDRHLAVFDANGAPSGQYTAPPGWSVIDFARHPSGDTSIALATARAVRFARVDRFANPVGQLDLVDDQAAHDPFYDQGGIHDDNSLVPVFTRDAVRIAAVGENVVVALRTGRNAVVAYRLDYQGMGVFSRAWRTLVEPGLSMFSIGITSGTFDTYGQLENHFHVHLDADAAGNVAVAVMGKPGFAPIFAAHADYFGQPIPTTLGLLVTRLAPDGSRMGTTPVDTVRSSELHGLRMSAGDIALVGRVFTERRADGGGWDAFTAHVDSASGALRAYRPLDVDLGEVLFDIASLGPGRFLVAGAAGYTENPDGASISEISAPLLAVIDANGMVAQRLSFTAGARQNVLRSLAPHGDRWLVGGMLNAPGTHSGDGNPALITADGFVHEIAAPSP